MESSPPLMLMMPFIIKGLLLLLQASGLCARSGPGILGPSVTTLLLLPPKDGLAAHCASVHAGRKLVHGARGTRGTRGTRARAYAMAGADSWLVRRDTQKTAGCHASSLNFTNSQ